MNNSATTGTEYINKTATTRPRIPIDTARGEDNARRIIAVCRHYSQKPLEELRCLELGASTGIMTECFAKHFKKVIAVDDDKASLKLSKRLSHQNNIEYISAQSLTSALADNCTDVVICNRSYELAQHPGQLLADIYRVIEYGGFCYFAADNKYAVIDRYYSLPFLSWLPGWLSEFYLKLCGKEVRYNRRPLSLSKLGKLTKDFWRQDYTTLIRQNPEQFSGSLSTNSSLSIVGTHSGISKYIYPHLSSWTWILTKKR